MSGLIKKNTLSVSFSHRETILKFFMEPKPFSLVLSLLREHIQGNIVEKEFMILIELNFISINTIVRRKRFNKNDKHLTGFRK